MKNLLTIVTFLNFAIDILSINKKLPQINICFWFLIIIFLWNMNSAEKKQVTCSCFLLSLNCLLQMHSCSTPSLFRLQVSEYRDYTAENAVDIDYNSIYSRPDYIESEDGELSWFNAGVRVGVGLGLGICLGIGIGVGVLVRTYQATTRNFKRRLVWQWPLPSQVSTITTDFVLASFLHPCGSFNSTFKSLYSYLLFIMVAEFPVA